MSIEGRLTVSMQLTDGGVKEVTIVSSRQVGASRVLEEKTMREALTLLPLIFSVCGTAQAVAGARACESALGRTASPDAEALREKLVAVEILREHLWRIFLDWPRFSGDSPDRESMAEVASIQRRYHEGLMPPGKNFLDQSSAKRQSGQRDAGELQQRMVKLLRARVFGMAPGKWLAMESLDDFVHWIDSHETLATTYLKRIVELNWESLGAVDVSALPSLDPLQLKREMKNDQFIRAPRWQGLCRETTPLTRTRSPLMDALRVRYGNGLLPRLAARLTEVARMSMWLGEEDTPFAYPSSPGSGNGIGQVQAARGLLTHSVELDAAGRIMDYRIVAPTEWNFHPRGSLAQGLSTLTGNRDMLETQARQLIHAVDPCVDCRLELEGTEPRHA